jgi:hypothetical protein
MRAQWMLRCGTTWSSWKPERTSKNTSRCFRRRWNPLLYRDKPITKYIPLTKEGTGSVKVQIQGLICLISGLKRSTPTSGPEQPMAREGERPKTRSVNAGSPLSSIITTPTPIQPTQGAVVLAG